MDIGVAKPLGMGQHRHAGFLLHAGDQALAAEQQQDRQRHSKEGIDLHQKCLPMVTVP